MCVICASPKGIHQPTESVIRTMFANNPHGAGYMYARNGKVYIRKGFMDVHALLKDLRRQHFTEEDSVVYHFRISTQAGVQPGMTHPFPLSNRPTRMLALSAECQIGIAHNGIIRLTTDPNNEQFSDTAIFITEYLAHIIRSPEDLRNRDILHMIYKLAKSRFAFLDGTDGYIATVGNFINDHGLLYSNNSYREVQAYLW